MKYFLRSLLLAVLGLAVLAGAAPTQEYDARLDINSEFFDPRLMPFNASAAPFHITTDPALGDIAGYDPSYEYHDYSTAQIWLGRTKKSVGSVIGSELYGTVYKLLDHGCPDDARHACLQPPGLGFTTNCMVHPPAGMERCNTLIWDVRAAWETDAIRKLLIGAVAGALEALTNQPVGGSNCYNMPVTKGCNVGDIVRVNFPTQFGHLNFMHVRIENINSQWGQFTCCESNSRQLVDGSIDRLGGEITNAFTTWWGRDFSRDTRCIINGWQAC